MCELLVMMVLCSSTDLVTDLVCEVEEEEATPAPGPASLNDENGTGEDEALAADLKRLRDSLKLGPESMALSSPERSENETECCCCCCVSDDDASGDE